jgi:hypothetical protein
MSHWEQIREFEKAKLRAESEERSQTTCRAAAGEFGNEVYLPFNRIHEKIPDSSCILFLRFVLL